MTLLPPDGGSLRCGFENCSCTYDDILGELGQNIRDLGDRGRQLCAKLALYGTESPSNTIYDPIFLCLQARQKVFEAIDHNVGELKKKVPDFMNRSLDRIQQLRQIAEP